MYRKYYSYNDMPVAAKPAPAPDSSGRRNEKNPDEKKLPQMPEAEKCESAIAEICEECSPAPRPGKFLGRFDNEDILLIVVIFILLMDDCDDDMLMIALAVIFLLGK